MSELSLVCLDTIDVSYALCSFCKTIEPAAEKGYRVATDGTHDDTALKKLKEKLTSAYSGISRLLRRLQISALYRC